MKQVVLNPRNGKIEVIEVPPPKPGPKQILVRNIYSLISAGTERSTVSYAQSGLIQKAKSRPDLVKQVMNKIKQDGIIPTINAILNRLNSPMPLGYSTAGVVIDIGSEVQEFKIEDRVACAGGGYAVHAEIVAVPKNLAVTIPENVDFKDAAFTTLGAIALQGVRLSEVKVGEVAVVIGLGLLGQITHQILRASGVKVIGFDINSKRVQLAKNLNIDYATSDVSELLSRVYEITNGYGADAVIITASTKSNQPVEIAGEIARKKGNVIVVGAVGLNIPRSSYYEKELNFRISCSYGPGRYDPFYEEKGNDYPYGYVRWTENRNMQAFLELVASGRVKVEPLITHVFPVDEAHKGYDLITSGQESLGILIQYPWSDEISRKIWVPTVNSKDYKKINAVKVGVIGSGNFAMSIVLPNLKKIKNIDLVGVASASGLSARKAALKFGFNYFSSDANEIINDSQINTVFILTRHNMHAKQVISSLIAGKNVYVEKPLCINRSELEEIVATYTKLIEPPYLFVGFNRRFAPFIKMIKEILDKIYEPIVLHYRVNAGFIPREHWTQDIEIGGGRLIGEGCHFIDLLIYLANSKVVEVSAECLPDNGQYSRDNFVINLKFENGSIGNIIYTANGNKSMGKEYLEIFGGGVSLRMDDYQLLEVYSDKLKIRKKAFLFKDKGHKDEIRTFIRYVEGNCESPMSFDEIIHSTEVTLLAYESLLKGEKIKL